MPQQYLPALSTYAKDIDFVIALVAGIVLPWLFASFAVLFWFLWAYRHRPGHKGGYVDGTKKEHSRWLGYPHYLILLFDILIIIVAVRVWVNVKQDLPEKPDEVVRIIGQQWAWTFQHAGPDGQLDTADDIKTADELHVVIDRTYQFELVSRDVLHSFSIPVFRLKQDVIPGRIIKGWFKPIDQIGIFDLQCAEMCGVGHGVMGAKVFIETDWDHQAWMAKNAPVVAAAPAPAPAPVPAAPAAPAAPEAPAAPTH